MDTLTDYRSFLAELRNIEREFEAIDSDEAAIRTLMDELHDLGARSGSKEVARICTEVGATYRVRGRDPKTVAAKRFAGAFKGIRQVYAELNAVLSKFGFDTVS